MADILSRYAGTSGFGGDDGFIPDSSNMGYRDPRTGKWVPLFDVHGSTGGGGMGFGGANSPGTGLLPSTQTVPNATNLMANAGGYTTGNLSTGGGLFGGNALLGQTAIQSGVGLLNSYLNRRASQENSQLSIAEAEKDRQFIREQFDKIAALAGTANTDRNSYLTGQQNNAAANVAPYTSLGSSAASTLAQLMGLSGGGGGGGGGGTAPMAAPPPMPSPLPPLTSIQTAPRRDASDSGALPSAPLGMTAPADQRASTTYGSDEPLVTLRAPTGQIRQFQARTQADEIERYLSLGATRV